MRASKDGVMFFVRNYFNNYNISLRTLEEYFSGKSL